MERDTEQTIIILSNRITMLEEKLAETIIAMNKNSEILTKDIETIAQSVLPLVKERNDRLNKILQDIPISDKIKPS